MSNEKDYWLDHSENVSKLFRWLCIVCLATLSIDLVLHKHEVFELATWYGFYGIFGFFACVILVVVAKQLRRVLMRSEDYYER